MTTETQMQIDRVLDAVRAGCQTSQAVSATTSMSVKRASAHLSYLCRAGSIRLTGKFQARGKGRPSNLYEPAKGQ